MIFPPKECGLSAHFTARHSFGARSFLPPTTATIKTQHNKSTMPKAGRRRKKTRTHVADDETTQSALSSAESLKVPKSLVVRTFGARGRSTNQPTFLQCLDDDEAAIVSPESRSIN